MNIRTYAVSFVVLVALMGLVGCARAARDTTGFAVTDSAVVNAPFMQTWQATKEVLKERKLDLDTRDKRGRFVAYTNSHRQLFLVPERQSYTITLKEDSPSSTSVTIQTLKQVYGVTLLTYPDWHDRKTTDDSEAKAILDGIQAKVTGEALPAPEPGPAEGNKS